MMMNLFSTHSKETIPLLSTEVSRRGCFTWPSSIKKYGVYGATLCIIILFASAGVVMRKESPASSSLVTLSMNDTTSNVRKNICASFVSGGDQSVGISAYVDPTCRQEAFVGCFGSTCRHCKVKETPQSKVFLDCPEETPEDLLQNCDSLVSSGDQAVGISAFQDPICLKGAFTGCFGGPCRLCKQKETPQSKMFVNCTSS